MSDFFDYVVVGGGLAGLAVAARLSENPKLTILVLEAGADGADNTGISVPAFMGTTLGTDIDWNYSTIPQKGANNRQLFYPRGKVIGGSSAINFLANTKAEVEDYKAIENLGNPGWGWSEIDRASKKSERLISPQQSQESLTCLVNPHCHGSSGPVATRFPTYLPPHFKCYFSAAAAAGHTTQVNDPFGGKLEGACIFPSAIDEKGTRVTSATAYYYPNQSRPNLVVRAGCEVDKLILEKAANSEIRICGVEYYSTESPSSKRVMVNEEVILSAGSIGSPAILERSGIGNENVLNSLGIPVALDLEGVGSNLSDHLFVLGTYPLKPGIKTMDDFGRDPKFAAEQKLIYENTGSGLLSNAAPLLDFQPLKAVVAEEDLSEGFKLLEQNPSALPPKQFQAVVDRIKNGVPLEFFLLNGFMETSTPRKDTSYLTVGTILEYPLSRGSTHIRSRDFSKPPSIDPGYLSHPFDAWLIVQGVKRARKIMLQPGFEGAVDKEEYPGPGVKTNEELLESIRNRMSSSYHPMGTCSMLPRDQKGVVSPELKVYGTQNLRVVDASVLPIQISAHPALTIYAIAEKAAEMILNQSD